MCSATVRVHSEAPLCASLVCHSVCPLCFASLNSRCIGPEAEARDCVCNCSLQTSASPTPSYEPPLSDCTRESRLTRPLPLLLCSALLLSTASSSRSFMSDEWYYVSTGGEQVGPVTLAAMAAAGASGGVSLDCLCWNASMDGWQAVREVPAAKAALQPPPAAAPARGPAPIPARPAAPTPATRPAAAVRPAAAAPTGAHSWKELKTAEGQPYYYNSATGQTTWDKPLELQTEADRERDGSASHALNRSRHVTLQPARCLPTHLST